MTFLALRLCVAACVLVSQPAAGQTLAEARQLFHDGKFADAKTAFTALARSEPANAEAAYFLGRIATIENQPEEGMRQFERAVELDRTNALYHYWYGSAVRELTPYANLKMPVYARRLKKAFDRAVELDPDQIDARFGLVQFYASAPPVLGRDRDRARREAAEIAKRNAMRGAIARGFIAQMEENAEAERAAHHEAIAAAPDSLAGYEALIETLLRQADAAGAFGAIEQYAQRRPADPMVLFHVGRIAAMVGQRVTDGETALEEFLVRPPARVYVVTVAEAHYRLGQLAERRGANDMARDHYREAVRLNRRSPAKDRLKAMR